MNSILQCDDSYCFLCGGNRNLEPLDKHHVYNGPLRDLSETYGLYVYLHHCKCHIFGKKSAHKNAEIALKLKRYAQIKAMEVYDWTENDFIGKFGKSYL